eukprot:s928_g6.t1
MIPLAERATQAFHKPGSMRENGLESTRTQEAPRPDDVPLYVFMDASAVNCFIEREDSLFSFHGLLNLCEQRLMKDHSKGWRDMHGKGSSKQRRPANRSTVPPPTVKEFVICSPPGLDGSPGADRYRSPSPGRVDASELHLQTPPCKLSNDASGRQS